MFYSACQKFYLSNYIYIYPPSPILLHVTCIFAVCNINYNRSKLARDTSSILSFIVKYFTFFFFFSTSLSVNFTTTESPVFKFVD